LILVQSIKVFNGFCKPKVDDEMFCANKNPAKGETQL